jgi:hypothetical protein
MEGLLGSKNPTTDAILIMETSHGLSVWISVLTSRHKGVFNGNPSCLECQNIRNQIGALHIFTPTTIWDFTEFLSWFIDVH